LSQNDRSDESRIFLTENATKREGEASDVQAPVAGISYVVFGSWDLGKPLSPPT